jgi:Bifunctional DNA primase/polymerase, N-terminal
MNRGELHREAHRLVDLGYRLVPIRYGGKMPLVRWKDLESGHRAVDRWMGRFGAMNLAVHTGRSGIVGLDADTDRAAEWIAGNCPETPMVCRTPRGRAYAPILYWKCRSCNIFRLA